ncbi:hypothetical protein Tco_0535934 [Tanacetum coccineum]
MDQFIPHSDNTHNDMLNQRVQETLYSEQTCLVNYPENEITSDSNIIPYSQYLLETQDAVVHDTNYSTQQDAMILSVFEQLSNQIRPMLYDGTVIAKETNVTSIADSEETLILKEESRSKMLLKQKVSTEQAFWFNMSNPSTEPSVTSPVKVEVPSELPKCFNLDVEFSKTQNAYNDLLKSYSQLEKHCISLELSIQLNQEIFQKDKSCDNQNALEILEYFENNDLKAQQQDKNTTISKLKEIIRSLRENNKKETVNHDISEHETINVELENNVAKLLSENEHLCNKINHVKQLVRLYTPDNLLALTVFNYSVSNASIAFPAHRYGYRRTAWIRRIGNSPNKHLSCGSLGARINVRFLVLVGSTRYCFNSGDVYLCQAYTRILENEDLKAQIQDKVFVITSLKKDLQKLKGKEIVDCAAQIPIATTIVLVMFKLDLDPLAPRLLQNRDAYIDYLKHTQEQDNILWGIVKQAKAKQPLDNALDFACCPDCSLVSGLQMFNTYDRESLSAHELWNVIISRIYYMEGLGHNLFSVGQLCDSDLEVAF